MKILHCDVCHTEVNDYGHWYYDEKPRNMYELKCIHESNSDTYNGMIFCHECIAKLLNTAKQNCFTKEESAIGKSGGKQEKPGELKYVGYSSHDDESRYQCPVCEEGYGSWDFINGSVRMMNGLFRCKCGKLLKKPE